jgi:hypothetical protein
MGLSVTMIMVAYSTTFELLCLSRLIQGTCCGCGLLLTAWIKDICSDGSVTSCYVTLRYVILLVVSVGVCVVSIWHTPVAHIPLSLRSLLILLKPLEDAIDFHGYFGTGWLAARFAAGPLVKTL